MFIRGMQRSITVRNGRIPDPSSVQGQLEIALSKLKPVNQVAVAISSRYSFTQQTPQFRTYPFLLQNGCRRSRPERTGSCGSSKANGTVRTVRTNTSLEHLFQKKLAADQSAPVVSSAQHVSREVLCGQSHLSLPVCGGEEQRVVAVREHAHRGA